MKCYKFVIPCDGYIEGKVIADNQEDGFNLMTEQLQAVNIPGLHLNVNMAKLFFSEEEVQLNDYEN